MTAIIEPARIHGPGLVTVDDVELPDCGPRDAIVDGHACGICGSDLSFIRMGGLAGPSGQPMALGHEIAGVVRAVGAEVADVAVGRRVVVHPGGDRHRRDRGGIGRWCTARRSSGSRHVDSSAWMPWLWATPAYRMIYDPDGRSYLARLAVRW